MLLAHDGAGQVVYMLGAISTMPDGPPDEDLPAMFAEAGVEPAGWVRVNDVEQADLVAAVLERGARISDGGVDLLPEVEVPAAEAPTPEEDPLAVLQARVEELTALVEAMTQQASGNLAP